MPQPGGRFRDTLLRLLGQDRQGVADVRLQVPRVVPRARRRRQRGGRRFRRPGVHGVSGRDGEGVATGGGSGGQGRRRLRHQARGGADTAAARQRRDRGGDGRVVRVLRIVRRGGEPLAAGRKRRIAGQRPGAAGAQDGGSLPRGRREHSGERIGGQNGARVAERRKQRGARCRRRPLRSRRAHQVPRRGSGSRRGGAGRQDGRPAVRGIQREPGQVYQDMAGGGAEVVPRGGAWSSTARAGERRLSITAVALARVCWPLRDNTLIPVATCTATRHNVRILITGERRCFPVVTPKTHSPPAWPYHRPP